MTPERCRTRVDFEAFGRARRYRTEHLWMRYAAANELSEPRFALAVGRAVGNAVKRNRLRRQLWAALSETAPTMAPGRYLIGATRAATSAKFETLRAELRDLAGRVAARGDASAATIAAAAKQ